MNALEWVYGLTMALFLFCSLILFSLCRPFVHCVMCLLPNLLFK